MQTLGRRWYEEGRQEGMKKVKIVESIARKISKEKYDLKVKHYEK